MPAMPRDHGSTVPASGPGTRGRTGDVVELDRGWCVWRLAVLRSSGLPLASLGPLAHTDLLDQPPGPARDVAIAARDAAAVDALLADDIFVGALAWQSPDIAGDWVARHRAAIARHATGAAAGTRPSTAQFTNRRRDSRQAFIARCAQRYCAKNDTIGFFGPVAWAELGSEATRIFGSGELVRRDVSFEVWAIHAVAAAWRHDPALLGDLPVRLDPACAVEITGTTVTVRRPHRSALVLDGTAARTVAALPDVRHIVDLQTATGLSVTELDQALRELEGGGVVQVGFLVPIDEAPERHLRRQIDELPDSEAAARLRARLDGLDAARSALAATRTPEEILAALSVVDAELIAAANGSRPSVAAGPAPGRRTPLYLDTRRDLDAEIGRHDLDILSVPLGVLLDSARWLTDQVGDVVEDALQERFTRLQATRGAVTLGELQFAAADVLSEGGPGLPSVIEDFQLRWAQIVGQATTVEGESRIDAETARSAADALFPEPPGPPRWAAARVHSPDVMLAETPAGRRWILGELHVALNTVESRVFGVEADDPDRLVDAVRSDLPTGRIVPVYPNDGILVSSRTYPPPALDPPGLYRYWSYGTDDGHPSGAASAPAAGIRVVRDGGELIAIADDSGWSAQVLECFGEFVTALVVNLFHITAPAPHRPRIVVGDVVVCRERWRFDTATLPAPRSRSRDVGHDRLRGWAREHGIPRHVFARTPLERKPFYVDFDAPLLVENLARVVRKSHGRIETWVELVEMVPGPRELWLADEAGQRFTSELRLVTVDPRPAAQVLRLGSGRVPTTAIGVPSRAWSAQ
jgi:hypothetical protein